MKRPIQFVAILIAALLLTQPLLADVFCLMQDGPQQMGTQNCCTGSDNTSVRLDNQGTAAGSGTATAQSGCNEGCCSVSPQNAPAPITNEKARTDSTPLVHGTLAAIPVRGSAVRPRLRSQRNASATARYLLLQAFRV